MVKTHFQPGGEVCESATLPDGRVIRVVGFEDYRSVTAELRAWLALLGLALLLFGCGGAEFSPGVEQPVEASAPDDAGSRGADSASTDGGEMEATTDACDRCSCPPEGAVCAHPFDSCTTVEHTDGLSADGGGRGWFDCSPLGTYDAQEAASACQASGAVGCSVQCGGDDVCGCSVPGFGCVCWGFIGTSAGYLESSETSPVCAGGSGWRWQ